MKHGSEEIVGCGASGRESEYLFQLARVAMAENNAKSAINLLRRAVTIQPVNVIHLKILGELLLMDRRFAEALATFKKALTIKPHDAETYFNLGMAIDGLNDKRTSAQYYKQAEVLQAGWK